MTIRESQVEVLAAMQRNGPSPDAPLIAFMLGIGSRQSPSGIRSRRKELVVMGLVYDTGKRERTATNRRTIVWAAA